jgi:hypothetical protein
MAGLLKKKPVKMSAFISSKAIYQKKKHFFLGYFS